MTTRKISRSKVINISLPSDLLRQVDSVCKVDQRTRSELFREAVRQYFSWRAWEELASRGRETAKKLGLRTEEDVMEWADQVVHEIRRARGRKR